MDTLYFSSLFVGALYPQHKSLFTANIYFLTCHSNLKKKNTFFFSFTETHKMYFFFIPHFIEKDRFVTNFLRPLLLLRNVHVEFLHAVTKMNKRRKDKFKK